MTDNSGRWTKGQSGNPSGRPRSDHNVKELARSHCPEAIETLATICRKGTSESARVAAAIALIERGYGKAPSTFSDDAGGLVIRVIRFAELEVETGLPEIEQQQITDETGVAH